jgi:uncharacterized protein (DUF433 family)
VSGTGIPTDVVAQRFDAGEKIESIAGDYEITPQQIEDAIRYERISRAA